MNNRILNGVGKAILGGVIFGGIAGAARGALGAGFSALPGAVAGAFMTAVIDVAGTVTWGFWATEVVETAAFELALVEPLLAQDRRDCEHKFGPQWR